MYLYLLAVWFVLFSSTHGDDLRVEAHTEEVVLPSQPTNLPINVTLECQIHNASLGQVMPQWTIENAEDTLNIPASHHNSVKQYTVRPEIDDRVVELPLTVDRLSYTQSGTYTCEAKDSNEIIKRATITLSLELKLEITPKTLAVSNETESVEMRCEMSQYIEPDHNLRWFRNGRMINNDSDKYTIHFEDGNSPSVINGEVTQSRVSVLVISDFEEQTDGGEYYCETVFTQQRSVLVYIGTEEPVGPTFSNTSQPTTEMTSDPTGPGDDEEGEGGPLEGVPVGTIAIAASCVGLVLVFLALLAIITCCICRGRYKRITEAGNSDDAITTINLWNDVSPPLPLGPRPNLKRASQSSDYYMNEGEDPEKPYCSIPPYISMASHSAHEQLREYSADQRSKNHYSHLYDRSSQHVYDNLPDDSEVEMPDEEYVKIPDDLAHADKVSTNSNDGETESYEYMNAQKMEDLEDRTSHDGYIQVIDSAQESAAHCESNSTATDEPKPNADSTYDRLASQ